MRLSSCKLSISYGMKKKNLFMSLLQTVQERELQNEGYCIFGSEEYMGYIDILNESNFIKGYDDKGNIYLYGVNEKFTDIKEWHLLLEVK